MSSLDQLFKVEGLHVLITGGGTGLGLMMAKSFARNGARGKLIALEWVRTDSRRSDHSGKTLGETARSQGGD